MLEAISLTLFLFTAVNPPISELSPTAVATFEDAELKEARQAHQAGDFQRAVTILKAYVEKKPKSFDAYLQMGISYRELNQPSEAVAALEKAIQLKPKSSLAQFELGQVYIDAKNYEGAIRQYRWLEKKDKPLANEFHLYLPMEIAKQYQLLTPLLDGSQADFEAAQPILPMNSGLKPEILRRERARYSEEARNQKVSGTVVLNIIYSKQGKVLVFGIVRGLPGGLTESCIEAAKKISFKPAIKNGQPVSVRGNIEYTFSLY